MTFFQQVGLMPKLDCPQLKRTIDVDPEKSLMKNLLENNIQVASSCGGDGICGKCRMRVTVKGELPKASELEIKTLALNGGEPGERLSCQLHLHKDSEAKTTYW